MQKGETSGHHGPLRGKGKEKDVFLTVSGSQMGKKFAPLREGERRKAFLFENGTMGANRSWSARTRGLGAPIKQLISQRRANLFGGRWSNIHLFCKLFCISLYGKGKKMGQR